MEKENKIIDIGIAEMKAAKNDFVLRSSGIGSCIVITLYDPIKKVGAMAHPMLPTPSEQIKDLRLKTKEKELKSEILNLKSSLRYVEPAIDVMITELTKLGVVKSRLESKLAGGANMFKVLDDNPESIGAQNVEAAVNKLKKEKIKIVATDTGENCGRSVAFDLATGILEVKTKI